jgi:RNA polymerase sigma-70 factor (ECF subfamily)
MEDESSWRTFFETYGRLLYNFTRKSGLNDQEAQDVVQETVIAVARKMPEFRYDPARGSFKQWLLLITRRRIQDHFRRVYRALPPASGTDQAPERVCPEPTPDAAMDAAWETAWSDNLFRSALERVRQRVQPKTYQVFDYLVLQEIPAQRVAKMLGLNVAQVYLAKHRVALAVRRAAKAMARGGGLNG